MNAMFFRRKKKEINVQIYMKMNILKKLNKIIKEIH